MGRPEDATVQGSPLGPMILSQPDASHSGDMDRLDKEGAGTM